MRRPEALGTSGAIAGVLEDALHRIAVLQVDGRGRALRRVAATGATTASGNYAGAGVVGIPSDGSQGPTQLGQFCCRVSADTQTRLGVRLADRVAVYAEAVVAIACRLAVEDPTDR